MKKHILPIITIAGRRVDRLWTTASGALFLIAIIFIGSSTIATAEPYVENETLIIPAGVSVGNVADLYDSIGPFDSITVQDGGQLTDKDINDYHITLSGTYTETRGAFAAHTFDISPQSLTLDGDAAISSTGWVASYIRTEINEVAGSNASLTYSGRPQILFAQPINISGDFIIGTGTDDPVCLVSSITLGSVGGNIIVNTPRDLRTVHHGTPINGNLIIKQGSVRSVSVGSYSLRGDLQLESGSLHSSTEIREPDGASSSLFKTTDGVFTIDCNIQSSGNASIQAGKLTLGGSGRIESFQEIAVHDGAELDVSARADALEGWWNLHAGQTLSGSGTVIGNTLLSDGAMLAPGDSAGAINFENDLDLSDISEGALKFVLGDDENDNYSRVIVDGEIIIDGLEWSHFDFDTIEGFGPGTYTLFSGTVVGDFGADLTGQINGYSAWIEEGSINLQVIPEPSTMVLLGLSALLLMKRRRQ